MAVDVVTEPSFEYGAPRVLFEGDYEIDYPIFDVHPDGERFLIPKPGMTDGATELIVVENWFAELERLAPTGR